MKVFFEEKQLLRNSSWIWTFFVFSAVAAIAPVLFLLITGEGSESPQMLKIALALIIVVGIIAFLLVYYNELEISIDSDGIHYRQSMKTWKWKEIAKADIVDFHAKKIGPFDSQRKKENVFVQITSGNAVDIELRSGKKIRIGTNDPDNFTWALRRMLNQEDTV